MSLVTPPPNNAPRAIGDRLARRPSIASLARTALAIVATAVGCYEVKTPVEPDPLPIRSPELQLPDTGTADAASVLPLTVVIDTATPSDKRAITLTTTAGAFAATGNQLTTVTPDASGTARSLLRAPSDSTSVIVSATVNGITVSRTVVYRRAMPEFVDLAPARFDLQAGSGHELLLTATLRRLVGKPSTGLRVAFSAVDSAPPRQPRGAFLPATATTGASGVATTRFTVADTTVRGPLLLRATVVEAPVSAEAVVRITEP